MTEMFAGEDLSATTPRLIDAPTVPPDLAQRMRALHIRLVGVTWNTYFTHWTMTVAGPFGPRGQTSELTKTMSGLVALVTRMEQAA